MKVIRSVPVLAFIAILISFNSSHAQQASMKTKIQMEIDLNKTAQWSVTRELTLRDVIAVNMLSSSFESTQEGEDVEIMEASTVTTEGKIIPVEQSDIVTQIGAIGAHVSYSGVKITKISFRNTKVGDRLKWVTHHRRSSNYFPGSFSYRYFFAIAGVEEEIEFSVRSPLSLNLKSEARELQLTEEIDQQSLILSWTGKIFVKRGAEINAVDNEKLLPRIELSTFSSIEQIGELYVKYARQKMIETEAIKKIAKEIIGTADNRREKAKKLFEWTVKNIRYTAIYFGSGRVVPNSLEEILSRRFGDCKDIALILGALLKEVGIESNEVLINTNPIYELTEVPSPENFNHVILYLPEFDQFIDATSPFSTFDALPGDDIDKPVVIAKASGAEISRTPMVRGDQNFAEIGTWITIDDEGVTSGKTQIVARGEFAAWLRQIVRDIETKGIDTIVTEIARARGINAINPSIKVDRDHLVDPYRLELTWSDEERLDWSRGIRPPNGLSPIIAAASPFFWMEPSVRREFPAKCRSGVVLQMVNIILPEKVRILYLPEQVKVKIGEQFHYEREWTEKDNVMLVKSTAVANFSERLCSTVMISEIARSLNGVKNIINPFIRIIENKK